MIVILDYDAGNIRSVEKAFEKLGYEAVVTRDKKLIREADRLILPGVGAFGNAMEKLDEYGLIDPIREAVCAGKPFLGICLGLQLLFDESDESPGVRGLSLLPGKVLRIPDAGGTLKIPHMGWNSLKIKEDSRLFKGLRQDTYVYFVHSYYLRAERREDVAASTFYGTQIDAAVEHENVFACQFHPEKSGSCGLKILQNFAEL